MFVTFLGTGTSQGIPIIGCHCPVCTSADHKDKRLRSSVMIETRERVVVIDVGPDFRQQMLREKVLRLDAVLFTHEHKDHVAGLDDVRPFNHCQQQPMDVWAEPRVQEALRREFAYVFADEKYPGIPQLNLHNITDNHDFNVSGLQITPIRAMHHRLPVFGFRIGDFVYLTDCNAIPEDQQEKILGARVVVLNALRRKQHLSHMSLDQALRAIEHWKPERAFLTHISHRMGLHQDVQKELPDNVFLAFDGLRIRL